MVARSLALPSVLMRRQNEEAKLGAFVYVLENLLRSSPQSGKRSRHSESDGGFCCLSLHRLQIL
jgi:hypothetical protein